MFEAETVDAIYIMSDIKFDKNGKCHYIMAFGDDMKSVLPEVEKYMKEFEKGFWIKGPEIVKIPVKRESATSKVAYYAFEMNEAFEMKHHICYLDEEKGFGGYKIAKVIGLIGGKSVIINSSSVLTPNKFEPDSLLYPASNEETTSSIQKTDGETCNKRDGAASWWK